jgi:hypothetical protein
MQPTFDTNMLLSHARLPFHFWASLNPDEDPKDNPGTSILSWIVAKSLMQETTALPKVLNENYKKTLDFSSQRNRVCDLLKSRIKTLNTVLQNYAADNRYRKLIIEARMISDRIKSKLAELTLKLSTDDSSYFVVNGELIDVKLELDEVKKVLNDEGILLEWEK